MTKDVPPEHHHDLDYLISMLDWDANVNPEFAQPNKVFPKIVRAREEMNECGYSEQWVTYGTGWYSAKELTVFPGRTALITAAAIWLNRDARARFVWLPNDLGAYHDSVRRDDRG
jgi:hypothetical protein